MSAAATRNGLLKPFLSFGLKLEAQDSKGMTPLLVACKLRSKAASKDLMEAGTDLMATENHGMIALLHLSKDQAWGWTFMENEVDTLLENGSPVDTIDSLGFSPLHYTLRQECHEILKRLLDAGTDPLKLYPEGGKTALHFLLPCMAQQCWPGERKPFFPLDQRFLDANIDRKHSDEEGNTANFGYVAVQPEYDVEYTESNVYPDPEEQHSVLSQYDILAINKRGETLLHVVAKRRASGVEGDSRLVQKDMTDLL